jgi:hypothetical protein
MPREPAPLAKWLLIVFSVGVLAFNLWNADALDVVFLSFAFLPWIVGPAALAALFVARAKSSVEAWFLFGAEVAVVCSTVWLWTMLILKPDAQNGIAMVFFPAVQFAALLAYALSVLAIAFFLRRRHSARL